MKRISTRLYLFGLVGAVVLPLLVFAALLLAFYAIIERTRLEQEAVQVARQISVILDRDLAGLVWLLKGLGTSSSLRDGNLARFHEEATRLVRDTEHVIVLRGIEPKQFVNTQLPFGAELPPAVPLTDAERKAFQAGQPIISGVYSSPVSGETRIAIAIPIDLPATQYVLAITLPTSLLRDGILPAIPENWIIDVSDRRGVYVTHSAIHDTVTGKPGSPAYLQKATGRSGSFTDTDPKGVAILAGFYRSDFSEWLIGANIPQEIFEAPVWRSIAFLLLLGLTALGLSILMAYFFGHTFAAAASELATRAHAMGEGRPVSAMPPTLSEFALAGDALASAAGSIQRRARERDLLVNELNHRVKNTLATVQSLVQQTMRTADSPEAAQASVGSRLVALARAHDVLTRENWDRVGLHDVVRVATEPLGRKEQLTVSGEDVRLPPQLALSLSLALHELATNATKYGALSGDDGEVSIRWDVLREGGLPPRLALHWEEAGGPPVERPTRNGFGSRLIGNLSEAIGGPVDLDFRPSGLICRIEARLD